MSDDNSSYEQRSEKFVDAILNNNGIKSVNLEETKKWKGNSEQTDYQEFKRLDDAQKQYDVMTKMTTSNDMYDVSSVTMDLLEKKERNQGNEYNVSTVPKQDYWDEYPSHKIENNQNKNKMNNIDEIEQISTEQTEPVDSNIAQAFAENKTDIVDDVEPAESFNEETEGTADVVDEVEPAESIKEKFSDNKNDVVDNVEPATDTKTEFSENAESMDVFTDSSTDTLKSDFKENAGDTTGSESDTNEDPDDHSYDLKPDFLNYCLLYKYTLRLKLKY